MEKSQRTPDIVIFGAGIAGLWSFHRLKKQGYDVILLEKDAIGSGQTIASQGIIHSGLKFSLAGKVNKLAQSISKMPDIWREALEGKGEIDLSTANVNAMSQHLLIPSGFMGGLTSLVAEKALGKHVHHVKENNWPQELKKSGFKGKCIFMGEPVLNIPSVVRALAKPYQKSIRKINNEQANQPFEFLKQNNIQPKRVIFTSAANNKGIAQTYNHAHGLETQERPLMQAMIKNAPFPIWAHLVGKTDKPVASITSHRDKDGTLIWYLGGGIAEKSIDTPPHEVHESILSAFKKYLPNLDFSKIEWDTLPINRIEGKSKTDSWMPDTPTVHNTDDALYCWPTKLTFAPMLSDMIIDDLHKKEIFPSHKETDMTFLPEADFAKTPWDKAQWKK